MNGEVGSIEDEQYNEGNAMTAILKCSDILSVASRTDKPSETIAKFT